MSRYTRLIVLFMEVPLSGRSKPMTGIDVVADLLDEVVTSIHGVIEGMPQEQLDWKPDPGGNSIGLTVWHVSRWMDVLGARILADLPAEQEQWHTQGWTAKTGYDPRGIGSRGLGTITGYTLEEAAAVPSLSAADLLAYLDQGYSVVRERLEDITSDMLFEPNPGTTVEGTTYRWLKSLIKGFFGHLGEIQAL